LSDTKVVRLKSKMHHTQGTPDFEEAQKHLEELRQKIAVSDENVVRRPVAWGGEPFTTIISNWKASGTSITFEGEFDPDQVELGVAFKGRWLRERGATL
jgi:hypothetical protein